MTSSTDAPFSSALDAEDILVEWDLNVVVSIPAMSIIFNVSFAIVSTPISFATFWCETNILSLGLGMCLVLLIYSCHAALTHSFESWIFPYLNSAGLFFL